MATNISYIRLLSGHLILPLRNITAARALFEVYSAPEGVLPALKTKGYGPMKVTLPDDADIVLNRLPWCRDFSGRSWGYTDVNPDAPFVKFIALTEGTADFLVVWEGGVALTGLHVEAGQAFKRIVEFELK